ncbi:unnamed protein product [Cylicostephanus goldi]|uniref:Uncharacterized protein n=1 Tax=Cylicostephanus goldi TaxID=71465 RepID=A0A3P6THW5_CYLGO|nr:unnamed protein product [Cylicostephanus goldi]
MMPESCLGIAFVVVDYDADESTRRNVEDGGDRPSVDRYAPGRSVAARNKQQINAGNIAKSDRVMGGNEPGTVKPVRIIKK